VLKNKKWANFQRIKELFIQKIGTKLSKIWFWDPGSEIRDLEKTYPGSWIQGSKRPRIPDPDPHPQYCIFPYIMDCQMQADADPDPAYHFEADPDPADHVDADPYSTF
jgi:hypothetical protein